MGRKRVRIDSKLQANKFAKRCLGDDDRISRLPDDILVDILSLLPLKEAARTSVLSSRWINLWKQSSSLDFDEDSDIGMIGIRNAESRKYVKWVNSVLKSHKVVTLKEFRICFDLSRFARKAITHWLAYAFSRQVQSLELDLTSDFIEDLGSPSLNYAIPEDFPNQITNKVPPLIHPPLDYFKSLKALSLKRVDVSCEAIEFFLSNCPVLEKLIVHEAKRISNLEVCGSSLKLKHLEICYCYYLKSVKVSAPNLTSLQVTKLEGLLLENVPMLVEVSVNCRYYRVSFENLLAALSCCISQLEILTLLLDNPKENMVLCDFPEMPKLKKLVIKYRKATSDESLIGLTSLIKASPYLQEFVLDVGLYHIVKLLCAFKFR